MVRKTVFRAILELGDQHETFTNADVIRRVQVEWGKAWNEKTIRRRIRELIKDNGCVRRVGGDGIRVE